MSKSSAQSGFTLIEIIVSLGVFSVVVTIAVGALLVMVASNQQLQSEQNVMTNLSFALDSMTREIRTGTGYYCDAVPVNNNGSQNFFIDGRDLDAIIDASEYRDCSNSEPGGEILTGLSFIESGDSISGSNDRVLYFYDSSAQTIFRRTGTEDAMPITSTSSGAIINDFKFWITGTEPLSESAPGSGELYQPVVTIFIDASNVQEPSKHFYLQTTITQRTLDL